MFGGYAEGADDLGDVDVAVLLKRRLPLGKEWVAASLERAEKTGRRMSHVDQITWGEEEVRRALRAASRLLDIQDKSDIVQLGTPLTPLFFGPQQSHGSRWRYRRDGFRAPARRRLAIEQDAKPEHIPRGELPQPQVSARSYLRSELVNGSPDRRRPKNCAKIVGTLSATHIRMETCRDIPYLCRASSRDVLSLP